MSLWQPFGSPSGLVAKCPNVNCSDLVQARGYAIPPDPSLKLTRSGKRGSIHAGCNAAGVAARKEEADER
ncbi:MAG: hypothetical protein IPO77_08870 [Acidobacteria bacterium]|nr:hypothetical protein [Acidobacteriota bacterium]